MIWFNTILSGIAVIISFTVLYLTHLRGGTVKMTQPSLVAFLLERGSPKICLQTLLFSTNHRGNVIENIWLKLKNNKQYYNFTLWAYRKEKEIIKGSGLFVSREGNPNMHYFLLNAFRTENLFIEGNIRLQIYCDIINHKSEVLLGEINIFFNKEHIPALKAGDKILFDWDPTDKKYTPCLFKSSDREI